MRGDQGVNEEGEVCVYCRRRPAAAGKKCCPVCLERNREAARERVARRRAAGICPMCGGPLDGAGKKFCGACLARRREELGNLRRERKAAGLCTRCGKAPALPGRMRCAECARRCASYETQRRGKGGGINTAVAGHD